MPPAKKRAVSDAEGLARIACDYCHKKKKRCSRTFPKCQNCSPWPGPCVYPRDLRTPGTPVVSDDEESSPVLPEPTRTFSDRRLSIDRLIEKPKGGLRHPNIARPEGPPALSPLRNGPILDRPRREDEVAAVLTPRRGTMMATDLPPPPPPLPLVAPGAGAGLPRNGAITVSPSTSWARRCGELHSPTGSGYDTITVATSPPPPSYRSWDRDGPGQRRQQPDPGASGPRRSAEDGALQSRRLSSPTMTSETITVATSPPTDRSDDRGAEQQRRPGTTAPGSTMASAATPDVVWNGEKPGADREAEEPRFRLKTTWTAIQAPPLVRRRESPPPGMDVAVKEAHRSKTRKLAMASATTALDASGPTIVVATDSPPATPVTPMVPTRPAVSSAAAVPNALSISSAPVTSIAPALPIAPAMSTAPAVPTSPGAPDVLTAPVAPAAPAAPVAPVGWPVNRMMTLSDAFLAISFEESQAVWNGAKFFYIPPLQCIDIFTNYCCEVLEVEDALVRRPSAASIRQALMSPMWPPPKALVIQINRLLHAAALGDAAWVVAARAFHWNMRTALDDAAALLQPTEDTLQALLELAAQGGDDFAGPNASWMLLGQACLQAKALGLHLSRAGDGGGGGGGGAGRGGDPEEGGAERRRLQRLLAVFWQLFVADKAAALAFGRPEGLEAAHCQDVSLPEPELGTQLMPTFRRGAGVELEGDEFAQCYYFKTIGMAKLTSRYSSALIRGGDTDARRFRLDLERWFQDAVEELEKIFDAETPRRSSEELADMELGLRTMTFHYLHLKVLVTQNLDVDEDDCLATARQALSVIPELITNGTGGAYSGLIWQLLYYPFAPFFVIFRSILRNPKSRRCDDDLELLGLLPAYFDDLSHQLRAVSRATAKLGETARAFHRLAEHLAGMGPARQPGAAGAAGAAERARIVDGVLGWYPAVSHEVRPAAAGSDGGQGGAAKGKKGGKGANDRVFDWFLWDSRPVPTVPVKW